MTDDQISTEDEHQKEGFHPHNLVIPTYSNADQFSMTFPSNNNGSISITALVSSNENPLSNGEKKQIGNLTFRVVTQPFEAWEKYVPRWNFRDFPHCKQYSLNSLQHVLIFRTARE